MRITNSVPLMFNKDIWKGQIYTKAMERLCVPVASLVLQKMRETRRN